MWSPGREERGIAVTHTGQLYQATVPAGKGGFGGRAVQGWLSKGTRRGLPPSGCLGSIPPPASPTR